MAKLLRQTQLQLMNNCNLLRRHQGQFSSLPFQGNSPFKKKLRPKKQFPKFAALPKIRFRPKTSAANYSGPIFFGRLQILQQQKLRQKLLRHYGPPFQKQILISLLVFAILNLRWSSDVTRMEVSRFLSDNRTWDDRSSYLLGFIRGQHSIEVALLP